MSPEESFYALAVAVTAFVTLVRSVWPPRFGIGNATALAMVAMWLAGRALYLLTGLGTPLGAMLLQDMVVIAAIYVKPDWQDCFPYRTFSQQLRAAWLERSPWDRAILALFPLAWLFYLPVAAPRTTYWTLYGIGLAQLALAGWEALHLSRGRMANKSRADDAGPPGLTFAAWGTEHG